MKLIDGIKLTGRPAEIPDCERNDLPLFFKEMGFSVGAEIGVDRGEFSKKFLEADLTLYSVDPWRYDNDYKDRHSQEKLDSIYEDTRKLLSPFPKSTIIRKSSMDALSDFPDRSLDFVYIDANHQLRYVIDDLFEWSKKVKTGGVVAGHDYIYTNPRTPAGICHVIYAVNAFTSAYKIRNWYLLGRTKSEEHERRDKWRSYMWINP